MSAFSGPTNTGIPASACAVSRAKATYRTIMKWNYFSRVTNHRDHTTSFTGQEPACALFGKREYFYPTAKVVRVCDLSVFVYNSCNEAFPLYKASVWYAYLCYWNVQAPTGCVCLQTSADMLG